MFFSWFLLFFWRTFDVDEATVAVDEGEQVAVEREGSGGRGHPLVGPRTRIGALGARGARAAALGRVRVGVELGQLDPASVLEDP